MQPRRYSTFEREVWKGYLISATPLVVVIGFTIFALVSRNLHTAPAATPTSPISPEVRMENLRGGAAALAFLTCWGFGSRNYAFGPAKSRREFFSLLLSLASLAYLRIGGLIEAGNEGGIIGGAIVILAILPLLPAAFLLVLVAARLY